jgi:hypothetical protein
VRIMTANLDTQYEGLSSREGFNTSLRHFNMVMDIIAEVEANSNLADVVNELVADKSVEPAQLKPIVNALLVDRYGYRSSSYNMKETVEQFEPVLAEAKKWTAVDMVLCYYSPELGLTLVNPKNGEHWAGVRVMKKNELVTLYCGAGAEGASKPVYDQAISKMIDLLEARKVTTPPAFTGGKFKAPEKKPPKAPAAKAPTRKKTAKKKKAGKPSAAAAPAPEPPTPAPQPQPAGRTRMTPLYGITVTNELFHNGNVEAWKKIIESYQTYHRSLRVLVFYEGERIQDINSLFKWGKVKRGTSIMIAVAGDQIKDVAKLQKYLRQGASPLFEAFLKGHPHKVLELF